MAIGAFRPTFEVGEGLRIILALFLYFGGHGAERFIVLWVDFMAEKPAVDMAWRRSSRGGGLDRLPSEQLDGDGWQRGPAEYHREIWTGWIKNW